MLFKVQEGFNRIRATLVLMVSKVLLSIVLIVVLQD